ncbi:hypothetical protein EJB05_17596, partial [Eragrostis curvula]
MPAAARPYGARSRDGQASLLSEMLDNVKELKRQTSAPSRVTRRGRCRVGAAAAGGGRRAVHGCGGQ